MAPKSKKSFICCNNCKVNITSKDEEIHLTQCPPLLNNWLHPFITNNKVYCNLEMKTDNINGLNLKQVDNCVFLTRAVIEMSGLSIGDEVVVDVLGKEISLVKTVWPSIERPTISAYLSKKAYNACYSGFGYMKVIISKLKPAALPAMEIFLDPLGLLNDDVKFHLNIFLQRNYINKVINVQNKFIVDFYGKSYKFKIKKVVPFEVETPATVIRSLETDLEKLDISNDSTNNFYRIMENTKWHLDSPVEETETTKDYFANIGGVDSTVTELREILKLALGKTCSIPGLNLSRGILLYGTTGSGKTTIAKALAAETSAYLVTINGPEIYSKYFGETESRLKDIFNNALSNSPSIILMDEIDSLCPFKGSSGSELEKRIATTLQTLLDGLHSGNGNVVVLATTSKLDSLDPVLRRCGRFDREIEIPVPNPSNRFDILNKLLSKTSHKLTHDEIVSIANAAHGFVGADLSSLCTQSAMRALKRSEDAEEVEIIMDDFEWALTQVKPSAMREVIIEVPNVKWSDIGGQKDLKLKLKQAVEWPLKHPESFERLGITPPRGILMFGPPGCSKTMIAKALANESKLNFISIKGPELFSKWVGSSERAVRDVFKKARQVAPSIVFFDEIDALGGERGTQGNGSNVQERVLAQILTELDGVSPLGNVTVVAATNRPDRIDKALLRPGRLDRIVYVPLPDEETRRDILRIKLSKMPVKSCVDLEELVGRTNGYSGAEVQAVCHEAALTALEDDLDAQEVRKNHFETALKLVTPRTPRSLIKLYEDYLSQT